MNKKRKAGFIAAVFGTMLLCACGAEQTAWKPINDDGVIKIAVIGDDEYIVDNGAMEATEMAADDFFGRTGVKIETVVYDDDSDYKKGIEAAEAIAADSSISAVIVKQELDYLDTVARIFEDAEKPFIITNGCYEHTIDDGYQYMIVDCINADAAGGIMADWVQKQGYELVAFCHSDTEYEEDELKGFCRAQESSEDDGGFQDRVNSTGVKLADTVVGPYTQEEFDIAYSRWQALGIDAVCISNYDILNSDLVRMLREKGSAIPVIGDYVMDTDEDIAANGEYLEGTAIVGMYINDFDGNDTEITERFREKYGMEMSEKAIQSYDIIKLLGEGLNSGISEPKELIEYMKNGEYEGISGTLAFDERGCLIPNGNEMLVFSNGAFSQINTR